MDEHPFYVAVYVVKDPKLVASADRIPHITHVRRFRAPSEMAAIIEAQRHEIQTWTLVSTAREIYRVL